MISNEGEVTVCSCGISSWADWSIRARYRILLSGLVTNPGFSRFFLAEEPGR